MHTDLLCGALNCALFFFLEEILEVLSFVLVINLSLFAEHMGIIDVAVLLPTAEDWDNKSNPNTCIVSHVVLW